MLRDFPQGRAAGRLAPPDLKADGRYRRFASSGFQNRRPCTVVAFLMPHKEVPLMTEGQGRYECHDVTHNRSTRMYKANSSSSVRRPGTGSPSLQCDERR